MGVPILHAMKANENEKVMVQPALFPLCTTEEAFKVSLFSLHFKVRESLSDSLQLEIVRKEGRYQYRQTWNKSCFVAPHKVKGFPNCLEAISIKL